MRRLAIILGGGLAGALIALAALPWWLPPMLRTVGRRQGIEFSRFERIGYARFALDEVTFAPAGVRVRIDRIETDTPLLWLYHYLAGQPSAIVASTWKVEVPTRNAPADTPTPGGAMRTRAVLFKVADALERWAPLVEVGRGTVNWPGGGLVIGSARWHDRTLRVGTLRIGPQRLEVEAKFARDHVIRFAAHPSDNVSCRVVLTSAGDQVTGELRVLNQRAPIMMRLPARGWMPVTAQLTAERWVIPAAQLTLGQSYARVTGDARLNWRDGHLQVSASAAGEPRTGQNAPPLAVRLHAAGGPEGLTVDSLAIEVPGVSAVLSNPFVLDRQGRLQGVPPHFTLEMNLAKQPWVAGAKGLISGRAELAAQATGWPKFTAELDGRTLAVGRWAIARSSLRLAFAWPRLVLNEGMVSFAEGGQVTVRGECNLQAREVIALTVEGMVRPSAVTPWLPVGTGFDSLTLAATAHGPFRELLHEGHGRVDGIRTGRVKPLTVEAAWHGTGRVVEISEANVLAGNTRVTLAGILTPNEARMTAVRLVSNGQEELALARPATVRWSPGLEIRDLQLAGPAHSVVNVAVGGDTGRFAVSVREFRSAWLADFGLPASPEWRLVSLEAQGELSKGPLVGAIRSELAVALAPGRFATVTLAAQAGRDGINLESFRIAEGAAEIVTATGRLPLTFRPGHSPTVQLETETPLSLQAATTANPAFWKTLAVATGLEFHEPELSLSLSGTWLQPQGTLSAKVARVSADPERVKFPFPTIEALDLQASIDRAGVTLDRLNAQVEGQLVRLNGRLPLTKSQWSGLVSGPLDLLAHEGSWRLEVPDAEMAAAARLFPSYLAPVGRLQLDVTRDARGEMTGFLRLRGAATRPIGPLGGMQALEADVQLAGRTVRVTSVTARMGGQPVAASGQIELPENAAPKYDFTLRGENLPLVRQTGLLVRADLDLKLLTRSDQTTALTGTVKLRDSMFLSDVRALISPGGRDPLRRPPFFSIAFRPVSAWRLGVDVQGEKFLRMRSAVFVGVASARFRLSGTLGEPRATGEARVDSGQVLLPFATFRVDHGSVRLTEADPYALRLDLSGTSRRYGYDLRMELTGTAAIPKVVFSSSPPLETSQVLLMVTAGQVPQDTISYGSNQRAARMGAYLGQSLLNDFGGDATEADRLSISTGERVSVQGRETYEVEYRLTDRLTLVGEYDEFDDYNTGLKWHLLAPRAEPSPPNATVAPVKSQEADRERAP